MLSAGVIDWTAVYYAVCFAGFSLLAGLVVSVRQYMWLSYCGQSAVFLVYFAALDGHLSALLGLAAGTAPLVSAIAGSLACATGFALCGFLLRPEHKLSCFKPVLLSVSGLCLLAPLALAVVDTTAYHRGLAIVFWLVIAAQVLPPVTWFFLPAWARNVVMPIAVLMVFGVATWGWFYDTASILSPGGPPGIRRGMVLWMLSVGATTMLAMTGIIQRARIRSADRAILAVQSELEAVRKAQLAERDMRRARELANLRSDQLASAAHDIRQPLVALRASAQQMSTKTRTAPTELIEAIDYVESLAQNYLQMADNELLPESSARAAANADVVAAQLILNSIAAMFTSDARAEGIELRTAPSSLQLRAAPLVLMRIAANCVTNAIQHSQGSRILVGWRRRGLTCELWVLDNGAGMSPDLAGAAFDVKSKGDASSGSGLGLAIVQELACDQGWQVVLASRLGQGAALKICGVVNV